MKICSTCKELKPYSLFYKSSSSKDGRDARCKECKQSYDRTYKLINKDKLYKETKDWKLRNKDKVSSYMVEYRQVNKDTLRESNKLWIQTNYERYRVMKNICNAQRRATKRCAFVKWADSKAIKSFYKEARELTLLTGIQHHVDHIYPLTSDIVCGLHVEHNLRVITATENIRKSNKFIEDIV